MIYVPYQDFFVKLTKQELHDTVKIIIVKNINDVHTKKSRTRIKLAHFRSPLTIHRFNVSLVPHQNTYNEKKFIYKHRLHQCCGSMTFWGGSGSADPCLGLMDPDSDPDPAIFVIDLQDASKKLIF